ncbi:MAG: GNAT family N-acetyltransferase [Candidatus Rokubacteria bacterium]|nr:GNAT family N-acetyltransferase [Candidatus Rokubacteria bacterium]
MTPTALVERPPASMVFEVRDRAALAALAPAWSGLAHDAAGQVFYRHEFISTWVESFAPRGRVRVVAERDGAERLTAVLPLVAERVTLCGVPVRQLTSASNVHSCRFDLLARHPAASGGALLDHLVERGGWDVLRILDVPEDGAAWHLLHAARARGLRVGTWASVNSPFITLPATVDALGQRLDAKFRANLQRRRRRLAEKGRVAVEHVTGGPALDARLGEAFALERSGWKGRRGTAIAQDAAVQRFYRDLARVAADGGYLSLYFMRLDGRPIACHYALEYGGKYLLLKPAYDETFRECSPGQLLTWDVVRDCVARGLDEFDFLGPDMPWKRDWTSTARRHTWLYVFGPTLAGRVAWAAKFRWLPAVRPMVDALRRTRHAR